MILTLWGAAMALSAQTTFEVNAPSVVAVGERFSVEFVLNDAADRGSFKEPPFGGVTVIAGPSTSHSSNVQFINGSKTKTTLQSWSYVVRCDKAGEYTIGQATVKADGKEYKSAPKSIKVIDEGTSGGGDAAGDGKKESQEKSREGQLRDDDILIVATVDRSEVYVGQPVVVRYKLYTRVDFSTEGQKMPTFEGFWSHRLNTGNQSWRRDEYRGKIYNNSMIVAEYLLFPQQAGVKKFEAMELSLVAHLPIDDGAMRHPIDEMFFGQRTKQVNRTILSNTPTLTVKALPEGAPAGYSGAVGDFEMSVTPPADSVEANSAMNYSVKISGTGNFSMIRTPELRLPGTFEQYTAKVSESIQTTSRGVSGYRQFDYPIIARAEGDYVIPAMEFSYFSPKLSKYVTLTSQEYPITVTPDSTVLNGVSSGVVIGGGREDLRILGKDIRFISLERPELRPKGRVFIFSGAYFAILSLMVVAFVVVCVWLRSYLKQMRNQATLKGKRANKVALARFRAAEAYMRQANTRGFYEEMLKGLWGYLSDKLNIPAADLTKENVRERLAHRHIAQENIDGYIALITDCEYAQYAPSGSGQLEEVYVSGVALISRLEAEMGK